MNFEIDVPSPLRLGEKVAEGRMRGLMIENVNSLIGQREIWRKPSVIATRSVSEGLCLTRSFAYASGYYFEKMAMCN